VATALTIETGPRCHTGSFPVSALELFESVDAPHERVAPVADLATVVQVLEGIVVVVAGDDEWILTPGDTATVAAGDAYTRWNGGDDEARWVEVRCAG
jgi:hypothetical protein